MGEEEVSIVPLEFPIMSLIVAADLALPLV